MNGEAWIPVTSAARGACPRDCRRQYPGARAPAREWRGDGRFG